MFSLSAVVLFVIVLGVLVLVHELGHALVAWWSGVAVDEFGIGFPPRLFAHKKNKTLYTINLIPLGGFVRLKGIAEHAKDTTATDEEDNFQHKSSVVRIMIVGAGIIMNVLVAMILFTITLSIGFQQPVERAQRDAIVSNPQVQIVSILAESPAAAAGIQTGDIIREINNISIRQLQDMQQLMAQSLHTSLDLLVLRNNNTLTVTVVPEEITYNDRTVIGIGVGLQDTVHVRYPWYRSPVLAIQMTAEMTTAIFVALSSAVKELLVDQNVPDGLTGPVGIAIITGQIAESGSIALLQFAAILSINLALFNVLPIPALDGGRLFFLLFELVTKKKVNQKIELVVHQLGFVLLITLMILVTAQDIIHLVK